MWCEISNNLKDDLKSYLKEGNFKMLRNTEIGSNNKVRDSQLSLICRSVLLNLHYVFFIILNLNAYKPHVYSASPLEAVEFIKSSAYLPRQ